MSLHNLIANGGKVVIVGGYNKSWPEYRTHPQLEFWSGDTPSEVERNVGDGTLPSNTTAVIISRFVRHPQFIKVTSDARRKGALIIANKGDGEVRRYLEEIVSGKKDEKSAGEEHRLVFVPSIQLNEDAPKMEEHINKYDSDYEEWKESINAYVNSESKCEEDMVITKSTSEMRNAVTKSDKGGWMHNFINQHLNIESSNAAEARRLCELAKSLGFSTTPASMSQAISHYCKENNIKLASGKAGNKKAETLVNKKTKSKARTHTPKVKVQVQDKVQDKPKKEKDTILSLLDDAIASLSLIKEEVQKFRNEQKDFYEIKEKLAKMFGK